MREYSGFKLGILLYCYYDPWTVLCYTYPDGHPQYIVWHPEVATTRDARGLPKPHVSGA